MKRSNKLILNHDSMVEAMQLYLNDQLGGVYNVTNLIASADGTFEVMFNAVETFVDNLNGG